MGAYASDIYGGSGGILALASGLGAADTYAPAKPWTPDMCPDPRPPTPCECTQRTRGATRGRDDRDRTRDGLAQTCTEEDRNPDSEACQAYDEFMQYCFDPDSGVVYQDESTGGGEGGGEGGGNSDGPTSAGIDLPWPVLIVGVLGLGAGAITYLTK